jgi:peptidoglycan/xylan/chitin deacetylase (PgdA/CDA1 family)
LKLAFLYLSKFLGLFYLSRYLYGRALRILCYHGFALADEHLFRPSLFIKPETFAKRLAFLKEHHIPVLSLPTALDLLKNARLSNCATVITIDDGFYSTYKVVHLLVEKFSVPTTLYVTTYYSLKETPVFRLVVQYMFWKTQKRTLDISALHSSLTGEFGLADMTQRETAIWRIIRFGEKACNEDQRLALEERLGTLLGVDFDQLSKTRMFNLLTREEIRYLAAEGIDIQLHTHRHCLPSDTLCGVQELMENKAILEPLVDRELHHFCYPSGEWSHDAWPILTGAGVKSAVTCAPGLNYPTTPLLALNRFIDGEHVSQIEFEAEMAGYLELLRHLRSWITKRSGSF